jgi:hypothetical protein
LEAIYPQRVSELSQRGIFLKVEIKRIGSKDGLARIAEYMRAHANAPKQSPVAVHLGLNLTSTAIDLLPIFQENNVPMKAARFLSCEKKMAVAVASARDHIANTQPVLLTISGHSNQDIRSRFNTGDQAQTIFGPHATFKITDIQMSKDDKMWMMNMVEIKSDKNAIDLPF